jgi:hypothetical protein
VSDGWVKRSHRYGLRLRAEEWYERKVPSNPGMIERITAESFHERHTRAAQTPVLMRVAGDVGGRVGLTGDRIRSESSVRSIASARSAQSSRSAQQVDRVVMTARARTSYRRGLRLDLRTRRRTLRLLRREALRTGH